MQVAHVNDHITHAVIGGGQAINFGISDDPAFFQILSSGLYKYPMLAMVRETICNGWDAHIDQGITHLPLLITLDGKYLTIRDYGKGIPDHLIGPIYGVYGASTKKNDGRQTGGFGLGCKSPFAYSDHFEVTSWHAGTKTIYNMSKSSSAVMGKPSITPLASFPTTETGIQVRIPLVQGKDNHNLPTLIQQVVFNGDIFANFNGDVLSTIGLDKAESGLLLINCAAPNQTALTNSLTQPVYVRYGNVVYPIERATEYQEEYEQIIRILKKYDCRLVIQAEPDTISVTPSREALTVSELTAKTVKELFAKFTSTFYRNRFVTAEQNKLLDNFVTEAAGKKLRLEHKLPYDRWSVPGVPSACEIGKLTSKEEFAMLEVIQRYSSSKTLSPGDFIKHNKKLLRLMVESGELDKGKVRSWLRTWQKFRKVLSDPAYSSYWRHGRNKQPYSSGRSEHDVATKWFHKNMLKPLIMKMINVPGFDRNKFRFRSSAVSYGPSHAKREDQNGVLAHSVVLYNHTANLAHLVKPTVILCHNNKLLNGRLSASHKQDSTGTFAFGGYFMYEVSRKKADVDSVKLALEEMDGIDFIDMTGRTEDEEEAYQERKEIEADIRRRALAGLKPNNPASSRVKRKGFRADQLIESETRINTMIYGNHTNPEVLDKPEYVIYIRMAEDKTDELEDFSGTAAVALLKLYGKRGCVATNRMTYDNWTKGGVLTLEQFLMKELVPQIRDNQEFSRYHVSGVRKLKKEIELNSWHQRKPAHAILQLINQNEFLWGVIPGFCILTPDQRLKVKVWEAMCDTRHGYSSEFLKIQRELNDIPLDPALLKEIKERILDNPCNQLLDVEEVGTLLSYSKGRTPEVRAKILDLVTKILN